MDRWGKEKAGGGDERVVREQEADPEDGVAVAEEVLGEVVDGWVEQQRRG